MTTAEETETEVCPCCSTRHKERSAEEKKAMMSRLKRIEGQVRGIERMVENDAYCPDILVQISAITSAMNSFGKVLLSNHIHNCVAEDIREGKDEVIDELCSVLQKMMK
ncbi:MAG: metal-sensing transcriptional repressor [Eubacteriales bacterium]|nr:metal-sensing transcriptional repressor [Eubacteriales bacterium]